MSSSQRLPSDPSRSTAESASGEIDALRGRIGTDLGLSQPFVIGQFEENIFAALIGDYDPMHNDPSWQFGDSWKQPIVLGFHALALAERFLREAGVPSDETALSLTTAGLDRVRFVAPLPVGQEARCSVHLDAIEVTDRGTAVHTTLTLTRSDSGAATMVAHHIARLGLIEDPQVVTAAGPAAKSDSTLIESIPAGTPIEDSAVHDNSFYKGVQARSGEWLGPTPWTVIDARSANAFRVLLDPHKAVANHPVRTAGGHSVLTIHPLHLLALRSYFMPQVGLSVLTDDTMATFNYGLDSARWLGPVAVDARLRDHVQLLDVTEKSAGRWLVKSRHLVEAEGHRAAVLSADCLSLFAVLSDK